MCTQNNVNPAAETVTRISDRRLRFVGNRDNVDVIFFSKEWLVIKAVSLLMTHLVDYNGNYVLINEACHFPSP